MKCFFFQPGAVSQKYPIPVFRLFFTVKLLQLIGIFRLPGIRVKPEMIHSDIGNRTIRIAVVPVMTAEQ